MDIIQELIDSDIAFPADEISAQPAYVLSGSGFGWFYSDAKRTMVRVSRGSECIVFEKEDPNSKKIIVQIGNDVLSIPEDELIEIGWN